jgi:PAS domain S-box-containing protein
MTDPSSDLTDSLDALLEGIQILSFDWRYLYVNDAVARQGRKSRAELLGRTMLECYPGIDKTPMFSLLERCMRERAPQTMENEFVYEDGSRAWFELRMRPCTAGVIIASLDVTERKSVEARLQDAYRQALRDLITPVIRVHEGVLLVPLVGALERARAEQSTEVVLDRVVRETAKVVIFDVSGVPDLDTAVAQHLIQATAMLRLLGATAILTGLSGAAARTIIHLGVDLSAMLTTNRLAEGIELALARVGKSVIRRRP